MKTAITMFASLVVSCALQAQVTTDVPTLQRQHVVRVAVPEGFEVLRRFMRQGRPTPDGMCEFDSEMRLKPGQASLEEVELEYDPQTCRSIVVQGHTRSASSPTAPRSAKDKASGPRSGARAADATYWASYKTWFVDPINITVNSVESKAWRPTPDCASGTCITPARRPSTTSTS